MLERTDRSLLDEWERMMGGEVVRAQDRYEQVERAEPALDPATNFKVFSARVRSDLHLLLGRLKARDWEGAVDCVRPTEDQAWDARRFKAEMAPYFEEHATIVLTPQARLPDKTILREDEGKVWSFQHRIVDPVGEPLAPIPDRTGKGPVWIEPTVSATVGVSARARPVVVGSLIDESGSHGIEFHVPYRRP